VTTVRAVAVVILTLDEAVNVEAAIESVGDWADLVVVVDSGSSDGTVAIAESCGAVVLQHKPEGPFVFAEQRTWALRQLRARGIEWVMFLDADERATPKFLSAVRHALATNSTLDGFYAAPMFMYQGTWLRRFKGFPNWHPRVARTTASIVGAVWEEFAPGTHAGRISEPYLHFVNSKGWVNWVERHMRYAVSEARQRDEGALRQRRPYLRRIARMFGPLRPIASVGFQLFGRRGFLDGGSVWSYARRQLIYELMIGEAERERSRMRRNLPL
jgi:glycosyltransferase involved in cell wall biosynthesis